MKIKEIIDSFLEYGESIKNYSPHTITNYRVDLKMFNEFCDNIEIEEFEEIKRKHIESFVIYMKKEKGYKPRTRNRRLSAIKKMFSYAEQQDIIDRAPNLEDLSAITETGIPTYLTLEESKRLLSAPHGLLEIRDKTIIATLLFAGLRISELVNLKVEDIDLLYRVMKVTGKGSKQREIPIQYDLLVMLEKYLYYHRTDTYHDYVFITKTGNQLTARNINKMIKKYAKLAGINKNISAHKLRHTFATMLYEDNDLLELKELMGHVNVSTTQIYAHVSSTARETVINNNPLSSGKENGVSNL